MTILVTSFGDAGPKPAEEPRFLDVQKMTFPYIPTLLISPSATQRLQFIWGVGIPLSFSLESLIFGMVFKAAYFLPSHLTNKTFPTSIQMPNLPGIQSQVGRRRRSQTEKHEGILEVLEEEPLSSSNEESFQKKSTDENTAKDEKDERFTRWHAYTIMESLAKG